MLLFFTRCPARISIFLTPEPTKSVQIYCFFLNYASIFVKTFDILVAHVLFAHLLVLGVLSELC